MENRFRVVFQKLHEALDRQPATAETPSVEVSTSELDEIRELRRIVLEVRDPEPCSYTAA